jgi:hypothetical protein
MILTRILGGSVIEQSAGLLQDISHTAFSHTVDYVYGDRSESFHESIFAMVMAASDIPDILSHHGLTWEHLFCPEHLIRIDIPAPSLCADRVDYTLRDLLRLGYISSEEAQQFVAALHFTNGVTAVEGVPLALKFVEWYRYLVSEVFMNALELFAHDELSRIIKLALENQVINAADLRETDDIIIAKIESSNILGLELMRLRATRTVCTAENPESRRVFSKARIVDPHVLVDKQVQRLSVLAPETIGLWDSIMSRAKSGILVSRLD